MNQMSRTLRLRRVWTLVPVSAMLVAGCAQARFEGAPLSRLCGEQIVGPDVYLRFVIQSDDLVRSGVDRTEVLDALECSAKSMGDQYSAEAVTALFHLAGDDADTQERLLRIVTHDGPSRAARWAAGTFLSYGAGDHVREKLLSYVATHWGTTEGDDAAKVLMDLADVCYLELLREEMEDLPEESILASYYEDQIKHLELAQDLPELLRRVASAQHGLRRRWLLLQAARHGASREEIRGAVVSHLRLPEEFRSREAKRETAETGLELSIFTERDKREFEPLLSFLAFSKVRIIGADGPVVPWATRHAKVWREVHGIPQPEERGGN